MVPVIERVTAGRATRVLFAVLLAWSAGVQFVGAWSYSLMGWTDHWRAHDNPDYASLWQWRQPQIGWHVANFAAQRAHKKRLMATYAGVRTPIVVPRERRRDADAADADRLVFTELLRDPAPLHNAAAALSSKGRREEALAWYRAALEIDPDYALTHAGMGEALFNLERYEEALESLAQALAAGHDELPAGAVLRLMGRAAQELGRPDAAAAHYERALAFDPDDRQALDRLARLHFAERRYAAALERFRTLAELSPDSAQTHANMGAALYYLDRIGEAVRSFERALALDPELETARAGLQTVRRIAPRDEGR